MTFGAISLADSRFPGTVLTAVVGHRVLPVVLLVEYKMAFKDFMITFCSYLR